MERYWSLLIIALGVRHLNATLVDYNISHHESHFMGLKIYRLKNIFVNRKNYEMLKIKIQSKICRFSDIYFAWGPILLHMMFIMRHIRVIRPIAIVFAKK